MKISFNTDDFTSKLNDISEKAKQIEGENNIPLNKLLNEEFIQKHTRFLNLDKIFEECGVEISNNEDLEKNEDKLSNFISENTEFKTWNEMLSEAASEYVLKQILGK